MSDLLRCAVIGAGAIAKSHIEGFNKHPRARTVAVAELNPDRRREVQEAYKLEKAVEDYHELLKDPSLDVIAIALPNYLHAQVAVEALKAGKHVFLEKPMATSAADAQRVLDAQKGTRLVVMVGQNFRFERSTQIVKDYVQKGDLGDIYHARAVWLRNAGIPRIGSWFTQKKYAGGGCGYDIGVHLLDCALHLMGCFEAESVSGITHARFGPRGLGGGSWGKGEIDPAKPFDVEDFAGALIKLKGGRSVFLEISWALHVDKSTPHGVYLFGTEGGAQTNPLKIYRGRCEHSEVIEPAYRGLPVPEDRAVHFIDCIVKGTPPLVNPQESLQVQRILDALYESARTGREIRLA